MTPDRLPGGTPSRLLWLLTLLITTLIVALVLGDGQDPRPSGTAEPSNARQQQDAAGEHERMIPANPAGDRRSSVPIPGGRYPIGSNQGGSDEQPVHTVCLAPFRIGRFEVTNAEFARFLNSLGVRPRSDADAGEIGADSFSAQDARLFLEGDEDEEQRPLIALDDEHARIAIRDGRFVAAEGWAEHPVTESTWDGARRYAAWAGGRLPTEVEWEAAARGRPGRTSPWGDEPPTPRHAVFGRDGGQTLPIGSRPDGATPEGVHDLAGNVDEWTSSLYRPYPYHPNDEQERVMSAGERITRGGNHVYSSADELRSAYRAGFSREPDRGHRHIGFRVVYPAGGQ